MSSLSILLVVFVLWQCIAVRTTENDGVLDKIKTGLRYAKSYLDTAKEIADLVSKSLGHGKKSEKRGDDGVKGERVKKDSETANLISGFFRLLGLESPRIAAIAVNSVIFLAQMISSLFDVNSTPDESESRSKKAPFDPMEFITDNKNEKIQNLLYQAQDPALPGQLIDRLDGFDSACIRLLMCKTSPIILAAQNSIRNRKIGPALDLTSWLPERETFEENADSCEEKHNDCKVFPEST